MASIDAESGPLGWGAIAGLAEAYDRLDVPLYRYLLLYLLPAVVGFLVTVAAAVLLPLPLFIRLPIPALGLLVLFAAVFYPKLVLEQERGQLENRLHLLITHMTVLSTTNIDRMEVFRELAKEDEYGALADEMYRVVQLVDVWNQSLDDALRRRAREVPSKPLSDFFDRLAYTLAAGQQLQDFLLNEQKVVIQNYVTIYEGSLENLEVMKDLYLSMILSMTFGLVFAVVLPILTGTDPTVTVAAVITMFVFVQLGFAYAIHTVTLYDPVWYQSERITAAAEPAVRRSIVVGGVLAVALLVVVAADLLGLGGFSLAALLPGVNGIPLLIEAIIPITPLLIPGLVVRRVEGEIKDRDGEFPSFIRALGASESAKQSTTSAVLRDLRKKDFGSLTKDVDNLYTRLAMRIDTESAWRHFTADSQSYLIQKFSEMYLIGRQMGGSPKRLGELISENMNEVLQLRERREQATITLIGLLYGITAASAFAFFIGIEVVALLATMSVDLSTNGMNLSGLISTGNYNIPLIRFLLLLVVLFNALLSALMIRTVDGGHTVNSFVHFVVLAWTSSLVAVLVHTMVGAFLRV